MPASANTKAVNSLYGALYGITPGNVTFVAESNAAALDLRAYANSKVATVAAGGPSNAALATTVLTNMGINTPELNTALVGIFAVNANDRGVVIAQLSMLLENIANNAPGTTVEQKTQFGGAAAAWNAGLASAYTYSSNTLNTISTPWSVGDTVFNMADSTVGGVKSMVLTGNQDVRIDMTDMLHQIRGLDLNGDGVIANDGKENASNVKAASGYVAVDAYTRLTDGVLNENNLSNVFKGDIKYDGTGFKGDGVSTNGNIVLGGLGADTILGGIGNDFLAGGGVASGNAGTDTLSGGRNADFFFTELSLLDKTDGNNLTLDGGVTADDNSAGSTNSAQDADWLLLQASDDDEPVQIVLEDHLVDGNGNGNMDDEGVLTTRAGQKASMKDIENVDASGNTYGFLKGLSATLGGAPVNANNDGIGSSAQLHITTEAGSDASNIIIGGYDNDYIDAGAGNDILMGGNLNKLIDPNLVGIVGNNDGRDELIGGGGSDNIAFEADGGIIEGGATQNVNDDPDVDTLWLTANSLGAVKAAGVAVAPVAATTLTTDNTLRFDLAVGKVGGLDNASGYGGADKNAATGNFTADQTNYNAASTGLRVQVQDMENVIATGLGAIDFKAAGANTATDLTFSNQQNFLGYAGNLTLRGTDTANTLYASNGTDVLEGRAGNDKLSGGNGDDDFVFFLQATSGDGVDVIHRQADANGDNLWDGYSDSTGVGSYVQDFGQKSAAITANSKLTLTLTDTAHPADLTGFPVNGVAFKLDGVSYTVGLTSGVQGTYAAFTAGLNAALDANPALAALDAVLNANNTITITDPAGKAFVSVGYTFVGNVVPPAGTLTWNQAIGDPTSTQTLDRLIYRSYEDRLDNELINDNAITGSKISLGVDAYAQDLVVNFAADGTRIAEDQAYTVKFTNLTTQDKVTIAVNGVTYTLQVGVDLDGNSIAGEDGAVTTNQATIQTNFLARLNGFINSFMDNDTAAGQVTSSLEVAATTLRLIQTTYNGEQTVFMTTPVVTIQQLSAGELAKAAVTNLSQHEVLLYNFDGRNLDGAGTNLDSTNVLFVGDTMVNQSTLQTANNLTGGTITGKDAMVVDGGANDLAGIANNTATNSALATNFSVHGDDFIMGASKADTINAGTGDDRVQGSQGVDALDGGKNYYAVQVLGEAEARVITWNVWEAANKTSAQSLASALLSSPGLTLDMLTSSTVTLINQSQDGLGTQSGLFDDTLIYAQGDFVTGSTRFTVALNNFTVDAGVVNLRNGGAGTVTVDLTGNGATADDSTSTFTNFENIRTVSGTGNAVAGVGGGQGNDTLDVSLLSTATGGISYDLTTAGTQGQVMYSANAHASLTKPAAADFESLVIKVDGVESVIGGTGDDLVSIDQSEAAKDNSFTGGLGDDRIIYSSAYVGDVGGVAEPTVTIKVNTSADVDQVVMTGGRVGSVVATDTLSSVEFISLTGNAATGSRENDVLDVRAMTTGAVVNYIDGTVKDLAGVTQVTIDGIAQIENVIADGDDTVIVASAAIMGTNTRADAVVAQKDLSLATFLDYDELTVAGARASFSSLAAGAGTGAGQIENYINEREFTFNLGTVGTDTVDYSQSTDAISARVELDVNQANQYVLADSSGAAFDATIALGDRLDVLTSVEKIVAAQGESVLDLTTSTKGLEVKYNLAAVADKVANTAAFNAFDVNSVRISDITSASPLTRSYLEYRDASDAAQAPAVGAIDRVAATWSRVEGSDFAERIILNSAHSLDNNTFNLRGGANEVKYNELTRSITTTLSLVDFDAAAPFGTVATGYAGLYASTNAASVNQQNGTVMAITQFQDGNSANLTGGGTHVVTSYTANNGIVAGSSLRIAASQDAEDTLAVAGLSSKVFLLSEAGTTDNQITVKLGSGAAANSVILTGYEFLQDAASNDVYDMGALATTKAALTFTDSTADHDAIKVGNDGVTFNGAAANTIDLNLISGTVGGFNMDFDVLDITKVTSSNLILVGGDNLTLPANADTDTTDEVVLGALSKVASMSNFESVVLTDASVAAGSAFTFNAATNTLTQGSTTITTSGTSLSFGGLMLESIGGLGNSYVADVATAVNVTVAGGTGATVRGGSAADTITGGAGADKLYGNGGNDILDGGTASEVRTVQFSGVAAANGVTTLTFGTAGSVVTVNSVAVVADVDASDGTLDILTGSGSIAYATAFQTLINARLANINAVVDAFDTGVAGATDDAKIVSVSRAADLLTFTFTQGINVQAADAIANAPGAVGGTFAISTDTTILDGGDGGIDTFVFEKTAALNGNDTINGFVNGAVGDKLDFTAFLGGAAVPTGGTNFATIGANTLGAANVWVGFNKATLSAADVQLVAAAGKVALEDNGKAVILVTADADGASDATVSPYSVYFVEDTDTTGAQNYVVTLVGSLNNATEIANSWFAANFV